jgi:hypothetical protein
MSWMGGCARDSVKLGSTLDCDSYRTTTPHRATAQVEYQRQADQTKPTEGVNLQSAKGQFESASTVGQDVAHGVVARFRQTGPARDFRLRRGLDGFPE